MDTLVQFPEHRQICALHQGVQGDALGHRPGRNQGPRLRPRPTSICPTGCRWSTNSTSLSDAEKRLVSQIQGRTYANVFGLVERFITAKLLEIGRDYWLGDQNALEALVRFSDEELKHQALFRRIEGDDGGGDAGGLPLRRRSRRRGARRAQQEHLGRPGADAAHRALRAEPLSPEHRARRRAVGAVQGRVPLPLEGRVPARRPRRAGAEAPRRDAVVRASATAP